MTSIRDNLQIIGVKLNKFAQLYHQYKQPNTAIKLLAVSKKHPSIAINEAYQAGQRAFGENYVQELLDKAKQLSKLDIEWHFIGPLQSNKTKKIAEVAHWVHTIDRVKIAQRLNDQRPDGLPPLNICLQVNISNEESKSGVLPENLEALALDVSKLPKLKLRGLMAIPAPEKEFNKQRIIFSKIRSLKDKLNQQGFQLDTLSMGMTNDMEAAVAEGATIVRIGTAIFGVRDN